MPGKKSPKIQLDKRRSPCPVASLLDIIGDKWTMLVIRDLYMGKSTYKEITESPEGIPTNILADRLKRLEQYNIISKEPYQENPVRYHYQLSASGQSLAPVLKAMADWGMSHIANTRMKKPSDKAIGAGS